MRSSFNAPSAGPTSERSTSLPSPDLPLKRPPPAHSSLRLEHRAVALDESVARRLRMLAGEEGATSEDTLVAAFAVLLHRYSGDDEVGVGCSAERADRD